MNTDLLFLINGWAGENSLVDGVGIFCASQLIYIIFLIAAGCLGFCLYRHEWRPVLYFCISIATTVVFLKLMTFLNIDHRPFMDHKLTQLIPHAPGESFPSDHTTSSAAVALGILFFTRFKKTGTLLLLAACMIGFSRIFVGVHYPADIAGGLLAALLGCGLVALVKRGIDGKTPASMKFGSQK